MPKNVLPTATLAEYNRIIRAKPIDVAVVQDGLLMPDQGKQNETPAVDGSVGTAVAVPQANPRQDTAPATPPSAKLPPWRVLLHNDDKNEMVFVIHAIVELTPLNRQEALTRMLEAHDRGVSLLVVTHKERAELYQDQFQSKGLTVTIEPEN